MVRHVVFVCFVVAVKAVLGNLVSLLFHVETHTKTLCFCFRITAQNCPICLVCVIILSMGTLRCLSAWLAVDQN